MMTSTKQWARTIASGRVRGVGAKMRGAAIVEFALIAVAYLILILGLFEFATLFWVNLTMQYAVREGARYAITGRADLGPSRYESIIAKMKDSSMGQWDVVNPVIAITINNGATQTYSNSAQYTAGMFGTAGDIVVFRLNCQWPLITPVSNLLRIVNPTSVFFPGNNYAFSVAATMRNEAFQ
jgi:Flp pilus assembly protein TadG